MSWASRVAPTTPTTPPNMRYLRRRRTVAGRRQADCYGTCVQLHVLAPTTLRPVHRPPSAPSANTLRVCGELGKTVATGAEVRTPPMRRQPLQLDAPDARTFIHSALSLPRTNRSVSPFASRTAAGAAADLPPTRCHPPEKSQTAWSVPRAKNSSPLG